MCESVSAKIVATILLAGLSALQAACVSSTFPRPLTAERARRSSPHQSLRRRRGLERALLDPPCDEPPNAVSISSDLTLPLTDPCAA